MIVNKNPIVSDPKQKEQFFNLNVFKNDTLELEPRVSLVAGTSLPKVQNEAKTSSRQSSAGQTKIKKSISVVKRSTNSLPNSQVGFGQASEYRTQNPSKFYMERAETNQAMLAEINPRSQKEQQLDF